MREALALLPDVLELFETSPLHFLHPVGVLFDRVFPSLLNGQYRLLRRDGRPAAFVNWAWLSPEIGARFAASVYHLRQAEWNCGADLWFCEIVAREGMMYPLMRALQHDVFPPGTHGRWLRVGPAGEPYGVGEVRMPGLRGGG